MTPRHFVWQALHLVTSTFVLRGRRGAISHLGGALGSVLVAGDADVAALCVAGVALGHIHGRLAWQAWRLVTSTVVLRGVTGVALMALGGALGSVLVAGDAAALCVAGVARSHIHFRFAWQAWHFVTSTFVLRDMRGTYGSGWRAWVGFSRR